MTHQLLRNVAFRSVPKDCGRATEFSSLNELTTVNVVPMLTRQSDVRKRGYVVPMFTRQSDVIKRDHVVPMFTRQSDVRKRGFVVPIFIRQSDCPKAISRAKNHKLLHVEFLHLYEYEWDLERKTQIKQ